MEREINTENWDIFDYYRAVRAKEKWIYHIMARKAGFAIGSSIVKTGVSLPEKLGEVVR